MSVYMKVIVKIKTGRGLFVRESNPYYVLDAEAVDIEINGGVLTYPDLRATQFEVVSSLTAVGGYATARTVTDNQPAVFQATRSASNNLAYAIIPNLNLTDQVGDGGGYYPNPFNKSGDAVDTESDRDPNRMLVSRTNFIYDFPAAYAKYLADSDANAIVGFHVNLLSIGEEQFGFAPVVAICKESVFALEAGSDTPFSRAWAIANVGALGRYAYTNANGLIFLASSSGVWILRPLPDEKPISEPLHGFDDAEGILQDLDENTVCTYIDDGRGNREVRIGTQAKTYVFSLTHKKWFTLSRPRGVYFADGNRLFGFDSTANDLTEEVQTIDVGTLTPAGVEGSIKTALIGLRYPGRNKRMLRIGLRQKSKIDQIAYEVYTPIDEDKLGGPEDVVITEADTDALGVYMGSVTVEGAGELVVGNVYLESTVVDKTVGAVVASGYFLRGGLTDQMSITQAVCKDVFMHLSLKGKPGQAISEMEFEFIPLHPHKEKRGSYSTL